MAEGDTTTGAEVTAVTTDAGEGSGTGFYNRRLHNYPLIKVYIYSEILVSLFILKCSFTFLHT